MLHVGWSSCDITPPRPAMVQGQMHRRIADSAMDPLTVTAMALDDGEPAHAAVFVSCDLCFVTDALVRRVRAQLAGGEPAPDRVILHATHTHTSMVIEEGWYEPPGPDVMSPAECEAWAAERIVEAVREAWAGRRPRRVERAFDYAVVGRNRYAVYADGHGEMYGKTDRPNFRHIEGYEDHTLDMLFVWDDQENLEGAALCIACPSQVDERLSVFSADYWHDVRGTLRERLGNPKLFVLPMYGAGGDQSPRSLVYRSLEVQMAERRGATPRQLIAQRVGDAVVRAWSSPRAEMDAPALAHEAWSVDLPPRRVTQADYDWAKARLYEWVQKNDETES